ncbi:agmatinase [Virgibacillus sp. 6R]|uniref:agmatinase n=1 Tax=Metabacillus sp. 22489 TaxID=3453928 RepID=UPI0011A89792
MYKPQATYKVPGFSGIRTFMHLPYITNDLENVDFAVIGVPFDTGASHAVGTRFGPSAIREMSQRIRGVNPALDIDIFEFMSGIDYGDILVHPGYIEYSYEAIEEQLTPIFEKNIIPILLGGDHSISLPHLRAAAKKYGPVSLVHFDAHSDTWRSSDPRKKYSHGNMFSLAVDEGIVDPYSSIQMGMRGSGPNPNLESSIELGYEVLSTDDVKKLPIIELCEKVKNRVGTKPVFLTFDVDFLDPIYAPGTGTPEAGGFTTYEAIQMIRGIAGINIIGFDIVETLPDRDQSNLTALHAANITFQVLSIIAKNKSLEASLQL